jgi:hypothetical protein
VVHHRGLEVALHVGEVVLNFTGEGGVRVVYFVRAVVENVVRVTHCVPAAAETVAAETGVLHFDPGVLGSKGERRAQARRGRIGTFPIPRSVVALRRGA